MIKTTPTQERDKARKSLAKVIYRQYLALEISLQEAKLHGIDFGFSHHSYGGLPALSNIVVRSASGYGTDITKEIVI